MNATLWRRLVVSAGVLVGSVFAAPSIAQQIRVASIRIIDPPGRKYGIGEELKINLNKATLRQAGGAAAVQARLIRGSPQELHRLAALSSSQCIMLPSGTFSVREYNGGVTLNRIIGIEWLGLNVAGYATDQSYTLVFEPANAPNRTIRIVTSDLDEYLRNAYWFVVSAPPSLSEGNHNRLRKFHYASRLPAPAGVPCYSVRLAANGRVELVAVESCSALGGIAMRANPQAELEQQALP